MELDFYLKSDVYLFMTSRLIFQVASLFVVLYCFRFNRLSLILLLSLPVVLLRRNCSSRQTVMVL